MTASIYPTVNNSPSDLPSAPRNITTRAVTEKHPSDANNCRSEAFPKNSYKSQYAFHTPARLRKQSTRQSQLSKPAVSLVKLCSAGESRNCLFRLRSGILCAPGSSIEDAGPIGGWVRDHLSRCPSGQRRSSPQSPRAPLIAAQPGKRAAARQRHLGGGRRERPHRIPHGERSARTGTDFRELSTGAGLVASA